MDAPRTVVKRNQRGVFVALSTLALIVSPRGKTGGITGTGIVVIGSIGWAGTFFIGRSFVEPASNVSGWYGQCVCHCYTTHTLTNVRLVMEGRHRVYPLSIRIPITHATHHTHPCTKTCKSSTTPCIVLVQATPVDTRPCTQHRFAVSVQRTSPMS